MSVDTYVVILSIFSFACSGTALILAVRFGMKEGPQGPQGPKGDRGMPGPAGITGVCNCKCSSKKSIDTDAYQ